MRQLRRSAVTVAVLVALLAALAGLAGCAAPAYTYVVDSQDHAYFKVPAGWYQVPAKALASAQSALQKAPLGAEGGPYLWSRAYAAEPDPGAVDLVSGAPVPIVYASVQSVRDWLKAGLSFDAMRDMLYPVTSQGRQQAAQEGQKFTGFDLLGGSTIASGDGIRGINELYVYDFAHVPDAFDQTVLTNTATTKLYLLLVQCSQACFAKYEPQIKTIVESFTVRGS
jgi:hypothetical protein